VLVQLLLGVYLGLDFKDTMGKLQIVFVDQAGCFFLLVVVKTPDCFIFIPSNANIITRTPRQLDHINRLPFLNNYHQALLSEFVRASGRSSRSFERFLTFSDFSCKHGCEVDLNYLVRNAATFCCSLPKTFAKGFLVLMMT